MAATDRNSDLLVYLQTLYGVTNADVTTLVRRYLDAATLVDRQNAWNALLLLAAR